MVQRMGKHWTDLPGDVVAVLRRGAVFPAHPLALDSRRRLDLRRQRALTRYYLDAGAGGLAVGVHTTQFAIRDAGLYETVLRIAAETAAAWTERPLFLIAGLIGRTDQALAEADTALNLGYHAGLLSLAAWHGALEDELVEHCARVADRIPLVESFDPSRGRRDVKIDAKTIDLIHFGNSAIDLRGVEQLVDRSQTRAVGNAIHLAIERFAKDGATLREIIAQLEAFFDARGLDELDPFHRSEQHPGNLARPRGFEIAAAINRLRTLRMRQLSTDANGR